MTLNDEHLKRIERLQANLDRSTRQGESTFALSTAAATALDNDVKLRKAQGKS